MTAANVRRAEKVKKQKKIKSEKLTWQPPLEYEEEEEKFEDETIEMQDNMVSWLCSSAKAGPLLGIQ